MCESENMNDFLQELKEVNFSHPLIQAKVKGLFKTSKNEIDKVKTAFEYVRDEISHSWDIQSKRVTCIA